MPQQRIDSPLSWYGTAGLISQSQAEQDKTAEWKSQVNHQSEEAWDFIHSFSD